MQDAKRKPGRAQPQDSSNFKISDSYVKPLDANLRSLWACVSPSLYLYRSDNEAPNISS
jgi:hypothetical protein